MDSQNLKYKYLTRDKLITAISERSNIRFALIRNTESARTAQKKHHLPTLPAFYLARTLSAASLMASFLKGEERIIVESNSNGIISQIYAEALQNGEVRGFIEYDSLKVNENIKNLRDIIGNGILKVSKILYNKGEPIVGIVELRKGDVSTDLAYYFAQSEQIPTAVILDVDFSEDNYINSSSGLLIQAMPGASKDDLKFIQEYTSKVDSLIMKINHQETLQDIIKQIFPFPVNILKTIQIDFFCRCSKDNFLGKLKTLMVEEIIEMKNERNYEMICQYCNAHYYLTDNDFDIIIEELRAKRN